MADPRIAEFGRKVREVRKGQGVTQERLAALAGLDRSYMGSVERGEKNVTIMNVFRIADALGVRPGTLFDE